MRREFIVAVAFSTVVAQAPAPAQGFLVGSASSALRCITIETDLGSCAMAGESLELAWAGGEVYATREGRLVASFDELTLQIRPLYSYVAGEDTVMSPVEFEGEIQLRAPLERVAILQNNVGPWSARILFVRSEQQLKFLLPAMFLNRSSEEKGFGFLAFDCDPLITKCDSPRLVFSSELERYGATPVGFPRGRAADASPPFSRPICGHCCVDPSTGRCKCVCSGASCPPTCHYFAEWACNDCQEAFLCNCS